jgi:hypothetical protein
MEAVNYAELAELAGEFLPERTVLGTVTTPLNNLNPGQSVGGVLSGSAATVGGAGSDLSAVSPVH